MLLRCPLVESCKACITQYVTLTMTFPRLSADAPHQEACSWHSTGINPAGDGKWSSMLELKPICMLQVLQHCDQNAIG